MGALSVDVGCLALGGFWDEMVGGFGGGAFA